MKYGSRFALVVMTAACAVVPMVTFARLQSGASGTNGTISGKLLLPSGEPAVGLRIAAVSAAEDTAVKASRSVLSVTQTDSSGRYRLEGVPSGRYWVMADPAPDSNTRPPGPADPACCVPGNWTKGGLLADATYFPGVMTHVKGKVVEVHDAEAVGGIDFKIVPAPAITPGFVGRVIVDGPGPMPKSLQVEFRRGGCTNCETLKIPIKVEPNGLITDSAAAHPWIHIFHPVELPPVWMLESAATRSERDGIADLAKPHRAFSLGASWQLELTLKTVGNAVSGRLVGLRAGEAAGKRVTLNGVTGVEGAYPTPVHLEAVVDSQGLFSFSDIVAGSYRLSAGQEIPEGSAVPVDVKGRDVTGIELRF